MWMNLLVREFYIRLIISTSQPASTPGNLLHPCPAAVTPQKVKAQQGCGSLHETASPAVQGQYCTNSGSAEEWRDRANFCRPSDSESAHVWRPDFDLFCVAIRANMWSPGFSLGRWSHHHSESRNKTAPFWFWPLTGPPAEVHLLSLLLIHLADTLCKLAKKRWKMSLMYG